MTASYVVDVEGIRYRDCVRPFALCALYIALSTALIRYNKFLMNEARFPFSMTLTAIHMSVSSLCCLVFYLAKPSMFPGLASTQGKRLELSGWFAPIGLAFAISLYTSNQAYLYCNVSFLQFLKQGNVIVAFLMSCAVGLQVLNRVRVAVLLWVIAGSVMSVSGEMHFQLIGFIFQVVSQLAECSRVVMGEFVLNHNSLKLDPLSYTMFAAPTCLVVLIVGNACTWKPEVVHALATWWHHVLPNALLAFSLNVVVAAVIKEVSAVGFVLSGVVKDITLVVMSCVAFREVVTPQQVLGFSVSLTGVFFWSALKVAPESGAVALAERLLGLPGRGSGGAKAPDETTALTRPSRV